MKRNIILSAITGAALLLLTASCSNTDENNEQKEPTQTVQFSFTNEDFGEDETPSRATSAAEAKPQIVDLGDCEAEITVENEPAVKKTRGNLTQAYGHYTIRAYQGGTLKGEMSGTFSGGTFTPDASSRKSLKLTHGIYDFIAFNDDVIPSGNNLTVARDKAETAMIGFANGENINQEPDQMVSFTMKHVGFRLAMKFVCKKDMPNPITTVLESAGANGIPVSVAYNPTTKAYVPTNGAMTPESNNMPATYGQKYWTSSYGLNYSYETTTTNYHYFLPTTEASQLKFSFSAGTIFWKPLTGSQKLNFALSMQSNKSYVIKIKLKPQYTYLMSNGDVGTIKETIYGGAPAATAKTPIALVLDKDSHMAIALKDAAGGAQVEWCKNIHNYQYAATNTNSVPNMGDALTSSTTSGIDETWNASYSTSDVIGEKVKGKNPDFPAFKAAADYNPGVTYTGSPALQWYLPSYNDWKWVLPLGFGDKTVVALTYDEYAWYSHLANEAFTQVGGTGGFNGVQPKRFWTSSEYGTARAGNCGGLFRGMTWFYQGKTTPQYVRAFVKY